MSDRGQNPRYNHVPAGLGALSQLLNCAPVYPHGGVTVCRKIALQRTASNTQLVGPVPRTLISRANLRYPESQWWLLPDSWLTVGVKPCSSESRCACCWPSSPSSDG